MSQYVQFVVFILLFTVLGFAIVFFSTYEFYEVRGDSMLPNYEEGQVVLVRALGEEDAHNTPIVHMDGDEYRIKRIIGIEGDEVLIEDQNVYVNGNRIAEPYLGENVDTCIPTDCSSPISRNTRVPGNAFFVLGDNRESSRDSRDCLEGILCEQNGFRFITENDVIGKIVTILPPWLSTLLTSQEA